MDQAIVSLQLRFEQLEEYGRFFYLKKLRLETKDGLKAACINLETSLKHGEISNIDGNHLFMEIRVFKEVLPSEIKKAVEVLDIKKVLRSLLSKYLAWI